MTDLSSGRVVMRLGPYATASAARTVCGVAAGAVLVWTRDELDWVAERNDQEDRVPVDPALDA